MCEESRRQILNVSLFYGCRRPPPPPHCVYFTEPSIAGASLWAYIFTLYLEFRDGKSCSLGGGAHCWVASSTRSQMFPSGIRPSELRFKRSGRAGSDGLKTQFLLNDNVLLLLEVKNK